MQRNNLSIKELGEDSQLCGSRLSISSPLGRRLRCAGNSQKICSALPEFSQVKFNRRIKLISTTAFIILLLISGCSNSGLLGPYQAGSPRAISTRNNQYGDFEGWQPVSFNPTPFASLTQRSFCQEGGDLYPDVSADGNWLIISSLRHSPNPDLYLKRVNGATVTRLTSDPASEVLPSFSPQADMVAYASNRTGNWDIWVIGVDGANPTRLTNGSGNELHPSWSPDGKQIVYCSQGPQSEQSELWIVDVENPGLKKWIGYGMFPEWCPDPKTPKIAFQLARYRGSNWFSVWTVDLVDGEAKFPTEIVSSVNHACVCPSWSPDGTKLAYGTINKSVYENIDSAVPQTAGEDIWMVDVDGRNNLRLTQSDAANFAPCWSPEGNIYFCSDRNGIENIWSIKPSTVNFSKPKPVDLTRHPQSTIRSNY